MFVQRLRVRHQLNHPILTRHTRPLGRSAPSATPYKYAAYPFPVIRMIANTALRRCSGSRSLNTAGASLNSSQCILFLHTLLISRSAARRYVISNARQRVLKCPCTGKYSRTVRAAACVSHYVGKSGRATSRAPATALPLPMLTLNHPQTPWSPIYGSFHCVPYDLLLALNGPSVYKQLLQVRARRLRAPAPPSSTHRAGQTFSVLH